MKTTVRHEIVELVEHTAFIDTHEHLLEERTRLGSLVDGDHFPCDDWAALLHNYVADDLASAGMPAEDLRQFFSPDVDPAEKFSFVEPWWQRIRHGGYAQALLSTFRTLYDEPELTAESAARLAKKYDELVAPGFYREVLNGKAKIELCQVNSTERIYMESEQPDLLRQDISFLEFARCSSSDIRRLERDSGHSINTLDEWLSVIDTYFERFGHQAVAIKNQSAYQRDLDYGPVSKRRAADLFVENRRGDTGHQDVKQLQDFLFRYCVEKATAYDLPVKLHTGYHAGRNRMPLARVRRNAGHLSDLLRDFPKTKFVLMHIGYPYQDEYIALAKHYSNAFVDMCWAWIVNPLASTRFVKEFIAAAPANKLFTFGGDYFFVENIVGHAQIARRGIASAISDLVTEDWLDRKEAPALIQRLMSENARSFFPSASTSHST